MKDALEVNDLLKIFKLQLITKLLIFKHHEVGYQRLNFTYSQRSLVKNFILQSTSYPDSLCSKL